MRRGIFGKALIVAGCAAFVAGVVLPAIAQADSVSPGRHNGATIVLESVKQCYAASERLEALKTGKMEADKRANGSASVWLKKVSLNEVNMATNRVERRPQKEVNINGRKYYVSNEFAGAQLQRNPSACFAKDPLTNKVVDKMKAATYADASGRVLYFESDDTYRDFIGLAN